MRIITDDIPWALASWRMWKSIIGDYTWDGVSSPPHAFVTQSFPLHINGLLSVDLHVRELSTFDPSFCHRSHGWLASEWFSLRLFCVLYVGNNNTWKAASYCDIRTQLTVLGEIIRTKKNKKNRRASCFHNSRPFISTHLLFPCIEDDQRSPLNQESFNLQTLALVSWQGPSLSL